MIRLGKVRMECQAMDVILYKPSKWNLSGRFISWLTNSPYSHAGIVLDSGVLDYVVEALSTVKMSTLKKTSARAEIWRYKSPITTPQRLAGQTYLASALGTFYDFGNLLDILINLFRTATGRSYRSYYQSDGRPICSELVARAFCAAGVTLCPGKPLWAVTPADLAACGFLAKIEE